MINSMDFFALSHGNRMSICLAFAFEIGAAASLCSIIILDKMNKSIVWLLFIVLTLFQIMNNTYNSYINLHDYQKWIELFGLTDEDQIVQKRIMAIISGALLPLFALGFIKALIDYIKPDAAKIEVINNIEVSPSPLQSNDSINSEEDLKTELKNEDFEKEEKQQPEEIILEENIEENQHAEFKQFMQDKKQKVDQMREPNLELLKIFYDDGRIKINEELPSYSEFLSKINTDIHPPRDVNFFLTLCNYLEISKLSGTQKIALKSYEEAHHIINNYFTISNPDNV